MGWASHVPVAELPWLPGDALSRVSTRFSPPPPLLWWGGAVGTEAVPGRFLATANGDEERGSQGTVTKEPLPWNLHLTPACWIVGCQGQGSEDTRHMGSDFYPTPIAYSPPNPGPLPSSCQSESAQPEPCPVLPPLCPSSFSVVSSPPQIGAWALTVLSYPSLSPGLCTHMRMAQMTSSLQRQEVRIPAIPSPSSPAPSSCFLPHPPGSRPPSLACIQQTHTYLAGVLPGHP